LAGAGAGPVRMTRRMEATSIDVDHQLMRAVDFRIDAVDVRVRSNVPEDLSVVYGDNAAIDEVIAIPSCRVVDFGIDEAGNLSRRAINQVGRNNPTEDRMAVGTQAVLTIRREPTHRAN